MDEKNNGSRRRKAFADFKENQYDDSFSLNPSQKRRKSAKKVFTAIGIIVLAVVFIILGFAITDSLMKTSEQPFEDKNTYTAAYINTTTTTAESETSGTQNVSEQSSSYYQQAGNY